MSATFATLIASTMPGGGLYPSLPLAAAPTQVTLLAATASDEQDTGVVAGFAALHLWVADWETFSICFYPTSGAVGAACPATTEWPPARIGAGWNDGRGVGQLLFYVNPQRRFFRLLHANATTARWSLSRV